MSDDLSRISDADPLKINTDQGWELSYWANKFGVSKAEIIEAVMCAGIMVSDVKKFLRK